MSAYRPTIWGGAGALLVFLLFLVIGLSTGLFWWFWLWFLVLVPLGGDWGYQRVYVKLPTSETQTPKDEKQSTQLQF